MHGVYSTSQSLNKKASAYDVVVYIYNAWLTSLIVHFSKKCVILQVRDAMVDCCNGKTTQWLAIAGKLILVIATQLVKHKPFRPSAKPPMLFPTEGIDLPSIDRRSSQKQIGRIMQSIGLS